MRQVCWSEFGGSEVHCPACQNSIRPRKNNVRSIVPWSSDMQPAGTMRYAWIKMKCTVCDKLIKFAGDTNLTVFDDPIPWRNIKVPTVLAG